MLLSLVILQSSLGALLHAPLRLGLLITTVLWLPAMSLASREPGIWREPLGCVIVLIAGATVLSGDRNSGALQVILTRPIRRDSYVLSHWVGLALPSLVLTSVQVLLCLVAEQFGGGATTLDWPGIAVALVQITAAVTASSAFLTLMGAISGRSPAWVACIVIIGLVLLGFAILREHSGAWVPLGDAVIESLVPTLRLPEAFQGTRPSLDELSTWLATLVASLALAIVALNRQELSYSDSATGAS